MALLTLTLSAGAQKLPPVTIPSPSVPPQSIPAGEWDIRADEQQEEDGRIFHLRGNAKVENSRMFFSADQIDWNKDTGDIRAEGHVYFENFQRKERIWASRMEYNTEDEKGKIYDVRGETQADMQPRAGMLTTNNPFYFQGEWAERNGDQYILHNGWVTNCHIPSPWWRLTGPKFDIIPGERAIARNSTFRLRGIPLFFTPFFYHSLAKEPRKSGFLMPNFGHSSRRGFMLGAGYYWAINRSYDVTYRVQDFTARGFTHHLDFRAQPKEGSDFDAVLYGVQDRGDPNTDRTVKYSGASLYAVGKSDLGNGWTAHGYMNYLSSFRFRQEWTESYNEAIGSEIHSAGFVNKNWSTFTFNTVMARLENFQSTEIPVTNPDKSISYLTNAVTIRKLPEAELASRDRQLFKGLPLWFSFQSAAGLMYRSAPVFDGSTLVDRFETGQFMNRVNLAPHVTSAFHFGDFHLVPSLGFQETYYSEAQALSGNTYTVVGTDALRDAYRVVGTNVVRSARDFSLDLIFPSLARIYAKKTVFGDKLKHVIEPRATYRYVTGIGQDFDKFIRFDETDLVANTNELSLSLANRIYAKRGDDVREIFTWELTQKRYFDPTFGGALLSSERNIFASTADLTAYAFLVGPRSTSPVNSLLRASPIGGLGIQWQADYDPRAGSIVDSAFSLDYRWQRYFISGGNLEVHNNPLLSPYANQYHFRGGFGDANRRGWNGNLDAVYDHRKGVMQYWTATASYNTDCCGLSVQYRRYNVGIRDESQYRISFSIANVGSFGTLRKQDRLF